MEVGKPVVERRKEAYLEIRRAKRIVANGVTQMVGVEKGVKKGQDKA